MNKCEGCDLYTNGRCKKYGRKAEEQLSTRDWLDDDLFEFISEYRICRKSSIFGNDFIGLTLDDIERIKNGEILHIPGEYGTFIGIIDKKEKENVKD